MIDILIAVVLLIVLIYGFNAIKSKASRQTKRIGLVFWLGLGVAVLGYSIFTADGDTGIIILGSMVAFFWVLPSSTLLYLDIKTIEKNKK